MSSGKKNDDGYRGYHIYYKKSNYHYAIEVQFFTERDYILNMWLHKYVYKYKDNMIGIKLKDLYDKGIIQNEDNFKEELEKGIIYQLRILILQDQLYMDQTILKKLI